MLKNKKLERYLNNYLEKFRSGQFRRLMVTLWIVVTGVFGYQLKFLKPDFEFEKFFPTDDPDIQFYENHLKHFGYDNDYLIVVIENDRSVFTTSFLTKVQSLTSQLSETKNIKSVSSPTEFKHLIKSPMGITPIPVLHPDDPSKLINDSTRIFGQPIFKSFFSSDGKSLILFINHEHLSNPESSDQLVANIQSAVDQQSFDHTRLVGKLTAQQTFIGYIQSNFAGFLIAALVVSFLLLAFIFRSIKIALIPYLISVTALIWLLGLMAWLGAQITILGSLIPPVILFVSSSDAVHLINAYRHTKEKDKTLRLQQSVDKVFIPTFLTSLTTAIGFFSLLVINTAPIQSLGIFSGLGVVFAFIITYLFIPLIIHQEYQIEEKSTFPKHLAIWVLKRPKLIFTTSALVVIVSLAGLLQLKTDAYLLEDLPSDNPIRIDFEYVDDQYGGSKPWELAYWPTNGQSIWDEHVMKEALEIHKYLKDQYTVQRLLSPVSFINYGHQMNHGGLNEQFAFPPENEFQKARRSVRSFSQNNALPNLISEDETYGRFAGFIPEYGSYETIHRNKALLKFLEENIDNSIIEYRLTGTTYLIDKSHELLSTNLLKGLLIAISMISIVMGFYFKSFKILIISLIPNILPLLVTAGYMGLSGIDLKLTTSIIFAVAFGIAVDDTIHFISAYRQNRFKNRVRRLIVTFQQTGKSIIITTVVIVSGFVLFIFSSFGATYYLGLFLSIALIAALITDLTLLPLLLHFWSHSSASSK